MKKGRFLLRRKEAGFFLYFHYKTVFYCTKLFDCAFNFNFSRFNFSFYMFEHEHKSNNKEARFVFYRKPPIILGAAVETCSGRELLDR